MSIGPLPRFVIEVGRHIVSEPEACRKRKDKEQARAIGKPGPTFSKEE